jgi:hypothetical protein
MDDVGHQLYSRPAGLATPRQVGLLSTLAGQAKFLLSQLAQYLDEFVVGQENAKKVLSVACVFHEPNRYGRLAK